MGALEAASAVRRLQRICLHRHGLCWNEIVDLDDYLKSPLAFV